MTFFDTSWSFFAYGRLSMIFSEQASPTPGRPFRSPAEAVSIARNRAVSRASARVSICILLDTHARLCPRRLSSLTLPRRALSGRVGVHVHAHGVSAGGRGGGESRRR